MKSIAFIGTREPRRVGRELLDLYAAAARWAAEAGCLVLTGGTPGAERLAAECALHAGGTVCVYLPWASYEQTWVREMQGRYPGRVQLKVYSEGEHAEWAGHVVASHPEARFLSPATLKLYARGYGLLMEADEVVALPFARQVGRAEERTIDKGSTASSLSFIRSLNRPLFDLSEPRGRSEIQNRLSGS